MGKKLVIGLLVGSVLLLALGLTMRFVYPVIYNNMASLVEGSPVYEEWVEPDYPIYMKYHFFTYNNSREFIAGEDPKPIVEYAGILSYREYHEKYDIEFENDDKKVKYFNNKSYVYDNETSSMLETDTVIVPNIVMFTINELYGSENFTKSNAASPFYEVEAADLLWGLYPNALLEAFPFLVGDNTKFGLQVNNTNDGLYEIYTGKGDSNANRGVVDQWNNASHLTYWYNETCNMINGTDGTIYPTDVAKDDRLYIFNTQICRSIFLISEKDEDVNGVSTTKYVAPREVFEVDFEDNVCFCEDADYSNCLGDGLLDVSQCYQELIQQQMDLFLPLSISLVVSSPEFLYADNDTIASIVNFDPNPEYHETYLNLDLDSGIILTGAKRIQLNTYIKKYSNILGNSKLDSMENLPEGWKYLIPLFWGEEVLPVDDSLVGSVKQSERVTIAVLVLSYISIGVGVVLLIAAIALVFYYKAVVSVVSHVEYQEKYDIEYESDDKKVKYYNNKWYVFDDETSSMAENDTVIVPNILMFTIMETAEKLGLASVAAIEINLMYKSENFTESNAASPFYEVEAADLLWGLYPNALLELEALSVLVGDNTKFGLQVNNTNDGLYEIYTGKGDSNENRGVVDQWNNASHLTYWYNETCNMINGTDGTIYPTDVAKDDRLYIFNTQICRSIFLISDKDEDVNGVSTTKYVAPSVVFEVDFEDNVCFCENADYSNCLGDGLLDVSQCYQELIQQQMGLSTPLYLSLVVSSPEFLYADNYTIDSIVNFDPNPEHHETYLNLDLDSGIILTGAKRIQLNTYIKQYWGTSFFSKGPLLDSMENLPEGWKYLIPLFWGEEVLPEDDSLVGSVKQSERVTIAVLVLSYISIGVGVVLLIAAMALVFYSSTITKQLLWLEASRTEDDSRENLI